MPTYIEYRYGKRVRVVIITLTLLIYVLTKISASLFAAAIFIDELFPQNTNWFLVTVVHIVASAAYTIVGGLKAVIYTEVLQTVVLLIGGFMVFFISLNEIGGFNELVLLGKQLEQQNIMMGKNDTSPSNFNDDNNNNRFSMSLFRPFDDPDQPWIGAIFGYYTFSLWYWAIDQNIVQRALAAKSIDHGTVGCLFAGILKLLPFFLAVVPGVCGRLLLERDLKNPEFSLNDGITPEDRVDMAIVLNNTDRVYAHLVKTVIPVNLRGIVLAGMLSALMSSLASVFNSSSTLFALNVYKVIKPASSEARLVFVGRVVVVVLAIFSVLWLPVMFLMSTHLFLLIQAPPAFLAPPITVLVVCGMFSRIPSVTGAETALGIGIILGGVRLVLETVEVSTGKRRGELFGTYTGMNFLIFAMVQFLLSTFLLFFVSILTSRFRTHVIMSEDDRTDILSAGSRDEKLYWSRTLRKRLMKRDGGTTLMEELRNSASGSGSASSKQGSERFLTHGSSSSIIVEQNEEQEEQNRNRNVTTPLTSSTFEEIEFIQPMSMDDNYGTTTTSITTSKTKEEEEEMYEDRFILCTNRCPGCSIPNRFMDPAIYSLSFVTLSAFVVMILSIELL